MPKPKSNLEYTPNNSFMTSQVKVPKPFGSDYEDPLEALKAQSVKEPTKESPPELVEESEEIKPPTHLPTHTLTNLPTNVPANPPTYQPTKPEITLQPVSPERDFSKVPNSVRRAIEQGLFPNSSLAVYMYLLSLTRTAIKPKRVAKVPKSELLNGSNLRAEKALLKNLSYLNSIGFIKTTIRNGDRKGNEYEVFTPDEIKYPPTNLPTSLRTNEPTRVGISDTQVPTDFRQVGRLVDEPINTGTSDSPKTFFKDNIKSDDEGRVSETFALMTKRLDEAVKKITGKGSSKTEAEKWGTLADLLVLELEVAASRTEGISSVPAFLTEVLRRQFFASRRQSSDKSSKTKIDTVGKSETGEYEIKPLDKTEREAALDYLREFAGQEMLLDFEKWYTPEDWKWLTGQLEK